MRDLLWDWGFDTRELAECEYEWYANGRECVRASYLDGTTVIKERDPMSGVTTRVI